MDLHTRNKLPVFIGNGRWRLLKQLGAGSFGVIYLGRDETTQQEVAVKLEAINFNRSPSKMSTLQQETKVYRALSGLCGVPRVLYTNIELQSSSNTREVSHASTDSLIDKQYHVLVMDLLGPNLEELFNFCHRKFTLVTVLMLAQQMIARLRALHNRGYIHRDVKPDNFLMGIGPQQQQVYLVDFGLSKRYYDPRRQQHMAYFEGRRLTGTARYASINVHLGIEPSRRDDLESYCYCLLYFLKSELPWQGIQAATKKQKYERILEKKLSLSGEKLCSGLPAEFALVLNYCRRLRFEEAPDYGYIENKFLYLLNTLVNEVDEGSSFQVPRSMTFKDKVDKKVGDSSSSSFLRSRTIANTKISENKEKECVEKKMLFDWEAIKSQLLSEASELQWDIQYPACCYENEFDLSVNDKTRGDDMNTLATAGDTAEG